MNFSLRRMFLVTLLFMVGFALLHRPIIWAYYETDSNFLNAVTNPWKHWVWLAGYDVKYGEVHGYIGVNTFSALMSVVMHILLGLFFIWFVCWAWGATVVEATEDYEDEYYEDYQI